ncbi:hypothetical protein D0Y65_028540, partial [Glycine soja]
DPTLFDHRCLPYSRFEAFLRRATARRYFGGDGDVVAMCWWAWPHICWVWRPRPQIGGDEKKEGNIKK